MRGSRLGGPQARAQVCHPPSFLSRAHPPSRAVSPEQAPDSSMLTLLPAPAALSPHGVCPGANEDGQPGLGAFCFGDPVNVAQLTFDQYFNITQIHYKY